MFFNNLFLGMLLCTLFVKEFQKLDTGLDLGRDYGYACPDVIQTKWSVCHANGVLLVA